MAKLIFITDSGKTLQANLEVAESFFTTDANFATPAVLEQIRQLIGREIIAENANE